jgi:hypothetical protein
MQQKTPAERAVIVKNHRISNRKWYSNLSSSRRQSKSESAKRRYREFTVAFKRQLDAKRRIDRALR